MTATLPGMSTDEKLRFEDLPERLLDWYALSARDLPWRIGPAERAQGVKADPYRVWMAEIMLQQTTVPHATRYYQAFTRRWPTVEALAAAADEDVMAAWAGLGYYARARNLLKCAREVAERGSWPHTVEALRTLPGIGAYTAGAVGALAFGRRAAAVDGNVDRVFARLLAAKGEWKAEKARIKEMVEMLVPADRPAEFAEALMDLGATVCTPKRPDCLICPLRELCAGAGEGDPARYPIKPKKAAKPVRRGHVYALFNDQGEVLTERRPNKGLLGGMLGLPGSDWIVDTRPEPSPPSGENWQDIGEVRHVFTHFSLELTVWRGQGSIGDHWTPRSTAADALPSVFAKALKLAVK
ncbi:A/G-specific adenine glycosylase [Hyphomonas sp. FCG-A18]|uniref:A/G-specific adenine glycosylase n=1 Tax=Hyphomonas sp. FCG-A18 TaxID=3080019 RepID=UPI002B2D2E3C|nr:A/G-specific adenine glycosylase [Hyphomonas sp. FCG-A18]